MATSGTAYGNGVDIGVSKGNNYIFINWQLASQNASINTSYINWQAYFHYTQSDAQLDDGDVSVNGSLRWDVPGRVKNFAGTYVTRDHGLASEGSFAIGHNTNGTKTFNINGSIAGAIARSSASTNFDLPAFDRSANTPSYSEITRTSATNFYVTYNRSGSVNGPTSYVLERATNAAMTANYINFGEGNQTVDANTTYYFRMYAQGDSGSAKYSSVYGPYHGKPTTPGIGTPSQVASTSKRISVPFSGPGYVGSGITSYTATRSGTPAKTITGISSTPFFDNDSNLIPGNSYTYSIVANTSAYTSDSSGISASVIAPGIPYAPTSEPTIANVGLDITITSAQVSGNGGVAINTSNANEGYFVQYQLADTIDGTYGYDGVSNAWSPAVKMSNQTTRSHTYSLMTPAKFYKFRTYAANPVIYGSDGSTRLYYPHNSSTYTANFATNSTGFFLAAGGKRWTGTEWIPTATAKRWDGSQWVAFNIAKRWDGNQWTPLS